MPTLRLRDGRTVEMRRMSGRQLATSSYLGGSRNHPVVIEVVAVDGHHVSPTRLAVMDAHGIWLSHQAVMAPRSHGRRPTVTGLTEGEAAAARSLFRSIAAGPRWMRPDPAASLGWEVRWGSRLATWSLVATAAATGGMFVIWLLLRSRSG